MSREFAWTGPLPDDPVAFVGYVNIKIEADGVLFTVRAEGRSPAQASYKVPLAQAAVMLNLAREAMINPAPSSQESPNLGRQR